MQRWLIAGGTVVLWLGLVGARLSAESKHAIKSKAAHRIVGTSWDPRGFETLDRIDRDRESRSFRDRLRRGNSLGFAWPGLRSLQVSVAWLELLQGLHNEASFQGDFSWMFSKLDTVISNSPRSEVRFITGLAPFFMVIGKDLVGANILMQQMLLRAPDDYNPWFWSGWHAMENLHDLRFAGDLYHHLARNPLAPPWIDSLAYRISSGVRLSNNELCEMLKSESQKNSQLQNLANKNCKKQ